MADITRLSRLVNGIQRQVDLSGNTLVVDNVKIKMGSGNDANHAIFSGTLTAARTISMPDANVDLAAIAVNSAHVAGDGSDHADVASNSAHAAGDGSDHADVASNTTHRSSNGADHSYIGNLQTLSGVAAGAENLGTFTGSTITDNQAIKAALQELETAIEGVGGDSDFLDSEFRISDEGDNTKKIAFQASGITTSTVRTVTMPDANVDLGHIANLQTLSGVAAGAEDLGSFTGSTIADSSTIKAALQSLETYAESTRSLVQNFEWQESAKSYIADNTAAPPTEVSGDRYVLSHDGGSPHANWDGASAGDVVEFDGSSWVAVTPTTGMFISVDDDQTGIYQWGGSAWAFKYFEATTASTGLTKVGFDIRLDASAAGVGLGFAAGVLSVNVDDSTIEIDTDTLQLKDGGIVNSHVNASAAIAESKLALDYGTSALNTSISNHVGDTGNPHSVTKAQVLSGDLIVNADIDASAAIVTSKFADATELSEAVTFFANTDISGAEAEQLTDGSNADSLHKHGAAIKAMVAGETFAANTIHAIRMSINGETDTRVYKADDDASASDKFHVIGLAYPTSEVTAGNNIDVVLLGEVISSVAFTASQDEGKAVYLGSTGAVTLTPSTTADDAVVKVGMVSKVGAAGTAKIMVSGIQIMGVN